MEKLIELLQDTEKLNTVIQNLAGYIAYVYPGIISLYSYNFLNAKKTHNTQAFIIKSIAISYVYILFLKKISLLIPINENGVLFNVVLILFSLVLPYFCYKLIKTKIIKIIFGFLGINTSISDVPYEVLEDEDEEYTCMKIYLRDEPYVYAGYIGEYEYEEDCEKFVILTGYRKYLINSEAKEIPLTENKSYEYKNKVYIKFRDIKVIEKIEDNKAKTEIYKE